MKSTFLDRLGFRHRLGIGLACLLITICCALTYASIRQSNQIVQDNALSRQKTSLRVLAAIMAQGVDGFETVIASDGTIRSARWDSVPRFDSHDIADQAGAVFGDALVIFGWVEGESDFIQLSSNIIRPDGSRAVGQFLGRENPAYAAILRGETHLAEAEISGRPYLTTYLPIMGPDNQVTGALSVGIDQSVLAIAIWPEHKSLLIASALAMIIGGIALIALIAWSLGPFSKLIGSLTRVAEGTEQVDIPYTDLRDEVGAIARGIAGLRDEQQRGRQREAMRVAKQKDQAIVVGVLRQSMSELANQNLAHRIEDSEGLSFPDDYEPLRQGFNEAVMKLADTICEIGEVAESVRGSAGEIGGLADSLACRVEQQAATLAQSASAITTLSQSAVEIAQKAEQANAIAANSRQSSTASRKALDKAISAIRDIEGSSGKISQISSVLEDIAFQTNLLALNAGVEAARAGDAGKGFAVVASEVRSLAGRAAESAKEINELIQTSRKQVSEGTVQVETTADSLSELLSQVEELGGLVGEIAGSIKHQAKGQAEISTGVEQLDTMTQQNAAIGEEANAAGHTLQAEAKRLMIALQGFKGIGTRPSDGRARDAA